MTDPTYRAEAPSVQSPPSAKAGPLPPQPVLRLLPEHPAQQAEPEGTRRESAKAKALRKRLVGHPRNEFGNLYRFLDLYGTQVRYLKDEQVFLVWDGTCWVRDDDLACDYVRRAMQRSLKAAKGTTVADWLLKQCNDRNLRSVLRLARGFEDEGYFRVPIRPVELDQHPRLLNVANGVVDLATGELRPHDAALFLTRRSDTRYLGPDADLSAACPRWLDFVAHGCEGVVESMEYLQRALGYSVTGLQSEKCYFTVLGKPDSGKSVLTETVQYVLGEYSAAAAIDTFLERRYSSATRSDLVRLGGRRFVSAAEVPEGATIDHALMKSLTGSDSTAIREVYAKAEQTKAQFKIWIAANHPPQFRGSDPGLANRVRLIPWDRIPAVMDKALPEKLRAERDGILTWLVRGAMDYLSRGALDVTAEAAKATDEYLREQSPLRLFEDECLVRDPGAPPIQSSRLYQAFVRWWTSQPRTHSTPMTATAFGLGLTNELGIEGRRCSDGVYRYGVRLQQQIPLMLGEDGK